METGTRGEYQWLEAERGLEEFLDLCESAILNRYLVITAVDAGPFHPSEEDTARGWRASGEIAYSPQVEWVESLPDNCCCRPCYCPDEWYIYATEPAALGSIYHGNVFEAEIGPGTVIRFGTFIRFRFSNPVMDS